MLKIEVSDEGIGIPELFLGKIFERFIQVDHSVSKGFQGTGLGLTITKKTVSLMGGQIHVKSVLSEGSTFTVLLPINANTVESHTQKIIHQLEEANQESLNNNHVVLIAEDDEISRFLICRILKTAGYDFLIAQNGAEAVELFTTQSFSLILMDIQMPIMDGIAASKSIRRLETQSNNRTPIIAMTAYTMNTIIDQFNDAGIDDYVTKPIEIKNIIEKLNLWISKS